MSQLPDQVQNSVESLKGDARADRHLPQGIEEQVELPESSGSAGTMVSSRARGPSSPWPGDHVASDVALVILGASTIQPPRKGASDDKLFLCLEGGTGSPSPEAPSGLARALL